MKASLIAVAFVAGLGAGHSASSLAGDAPVRDAGPESMQLDIVECVPSRRNPAPVSNVSAILDAYLRIHADVRADAMIVGLPSREIDGGIAAEAASNCTGEETPVLWDSGRVIAVVHASLPSARKLASLDEGRSEKGATGPFESPISAEKPARPRRTGFPEVP